MVKKIIRNFDVDRHENKKDKYYSKVVAVCFSLFVYAAAILYSGGLFALFSIVGFVGDSILLKSPLYFSLLYFSFMQIVIVVFVAFSCLHDEMKKLKVLKKGLYEN